MVPNSGPENGPGLRVICPRGQPSFGFVLCTRHTVLGSDPCNVLWHRCGARHIMSQTVGLTPRDRGLSVDIVWEKIRPGRVAFFGHKEHAAADAPFANTSFFRCSAEVGVISRKQPSQHASPSWDMLAQIPTNWSENKVGRLRGCFP
jgi:hypothetical protein